MATIGSMLTPGANSACAAPNPNKTCSVCEDSSCKCKPGDITFTVSSTDNYQLTQAQLGEWHQKCDKFPWAVITVNQPIDDDGDIVYDPSECNVPDPQIPNKFSRIVCYSCY